MAITLSQVRERLQAAWNAVALGELSYSHNNHATTFHTLSEMQKHIDWLRGLERELEADDESVGGSAVVRFVEAG